MTTYISSLCFICKHFTGFLEGTEIISEIPVCRAFPKGIPGKFTSKEDEHTKPEPGDGGIQFEPTDEEQYRQFRIR